MPAFLWHAFVNSQFIAQHLVVSKSMILYLLVYAYGHILLFLLQALKMEQQTDERKGKAGHFHCPLHNHW